MIRLVSVFTIGIGYWYLQDPIILNIGYWVAFFDILTLHMAGIKRQLAAKYEMF